MQSYTPEHYALVAAANHDYASFFREEIAFRRDAHYPPFGRLVRFVYAATNPVRAQQMVEELVERVKEEIARLGIADTGVIGAGASVRRTRPWPLPLALDPARARCAPRARRLGPLPGWTVDVDPVSMLEALAEIEFIEQQGVGAVERRVRCRRSKR